MPIFSLLPLLSPTVASLLSLCNSQKICPPPSVLYTSHTLTACCGLTEKSPFLPSSLPLAMLAPLLLFSTLSFSRRLRQRELAHIDRYVVWYCSSKIPFLASCCFLKEVPLSLFLSVQSRRRKDLVQCCSSSQESPLFYPTHPVCTVLLLTLAID